jgi:signal transduction histidine kinase
LRLRAELLDDEQQTARFNHDLDDLEILVKGALQSVKETDIHENIQQVDLLKLLLQISENRTDKIMIQAGEIALYRGKPFALKRCLSNLIDNGVKYAGSVNVQVFDNIEELRIIIQDNGPGIPENEIETIFQPFKRLHNDTQGHGLGLGIARNIVHAHNGDLYLANRKEGGLEVLIIFPRIYKNRR